MVGTMKIFALEPLKKEFEGIWRIIGRSSVSRKGSTIHSGLSSRLNSYVSNCDSARRRGLAKVGSSLECFRNNLDLFCR